MYLTLKEIEENSSKIQQEFKALIENELIVPRRSSRQWQFFESCFNTLFKKESDFDCSASRARDYKHQITKRLDRFIKESSGKNRQFLFSIAHKTDLPSEFTDYPSCNKYVMRVSFNKTEAKVIKEKSVRKELIKKSVSDAIDLEFETYKKLPTNDLPKVLLELQKVFDKDGAAYKKISKTLRKRNKYKHTIYNPNNPSRKQLKEIEIVSFDFKNNKAVVETKELFHLKWYSQETEDYVQNIYHKENIQTYILEWKNDKWMVIKNIYPEKNPKILIED